ncbi:TOBE domain-containing protein [Halotalea alkalilenta]|uniref:TOBE domain-containing protein n=1 Tax=Halotalea alkalilenta TaxID=376489 RepID=UPI000480F312|nr:TOBE domain-containing protein [Halotalea alkalilenta]
MKASARNVLKGTVTGVKLGAVNAEVTLDLGGGTQFVAIVTVESVHSLGIAVGKEAIALVKAPWVMLMTEGSDIRLSARNCFKGEVTQVTDGAVNAEVIVRLANGSEIHSIITRQAVAELDLAVGVEATVVIKASHVILGVPA